MIGRRIFAALALGAIVLAGCGAGDDETDETIPPATPVPTIAGVGNVPAVPSAVREPVVVVRPPVNVDGSQAELIGEIADGNRVLMIGDSILASTSSRYGNQMCEALVPLGWQVAVEAEPSRFVDFGNLVLDRLLPDDVAPEDDWDAAVVFLGSNYGSNALRYEAELVEILDRLAPRPVLLFTVTEYRPNYVEVNEVVNRLGAAADNVTVLDWKTISETPGVLSSDGLHPTDTGRRVLAESVAVALGPIDGTGECLRSTFRDDSAVGGDSTTVLGRPSTSSTSTRPATATTTTAAPSTNQTPTTLAPTTSPTPATTLAPAPAPTTTTPPPTTPATPATTATPATPTTLPPQENSGEDAGAAAPLPEPPTQPVP